MRRHGRPVRSRGSAAPIAAEHPRIANQWVRRVPLRPDPRSECEMARHLARLRSAPPAIAFARYSPLCELSRSIIDNGWIGMELNCDDIDRTPPSGMLDSSLTLGPKDSTIGLPTRANVPRLDQDITGRAKVTFGRKLPELLQSLRVPADSRVGSHARCAARRCGIISRSGQVQGYPTDEQSRIRQTNIGSGVRLQKDKDGHAESFVNHKKVRPTLGREYSGDGNIGTFWGRGR
jgi:hypothetical protein